ncbi:MAG TPA: amidohydrolase [Bacteroidales bacterium]|jgi:imidazolonepropionase-like amidohydrolase|nr:amidohydrolase [Bacteroidales bacterium]HBZ19554.1 amidohydrolase [Bacteroidales bacterium]
MKKKLIYTLLLIASCILNSEAQNPVVAPPQTRPVILTGGTIHTGTGDIIENGLVAFTAGKIAWAGKASAFTGERSGYEVIDVTGKQVYPAFIYPNTSLGLIEISGVDVTVDNREMGDLNPDVRTIVAYNTDSHVIPVVRSNGVLIAQIVPSGTLLPGTSSIVQLDAWNWKDAIYKADDGVILGWPRKAAASRRGGFNPTGTTQGTAEDTYGRNVELLEKIFTDGLAYSQVEKPVDANLRLEALKGLFNGTKTLFVNASEPRGIIAAISFAKRYGVKKIVLTNADESAWAVKDFLKENNIPVIIAHVHSLPKYEDSDTRLPFKLAAMFKKEGILVGLTYQNQAYGYNLPFVAGQTVAYGLTREEALQTITINNARILGIDNITGTLETGKDANIIVSSGDALDMLTNNIEYAFVSGRNISLDNKHKQLYRRFQEKYKAVKQGK